MKAIEPRFAVRIEVALVPESLNASSSVSNVPPLTREIAPVWPAIREAMSLSNASPHVLPCEVELPSMRMIGVLAPDLTLIRSYGVWLSLKVTRLKEKGVVLRSLEVRADASIHGA